MGNSGLFSYVYKKAEGKDNERAIKEVVLETLATEISGTASRIGITMAGRILGGYVGSVIPIAGTIIGAVVGAWLAGKIEEWWFAEEDSKLAKDKAENERIERLEKEYKLKIDRIIDYLVRYHYIELR